MQSISSFTYQHPWVSRANVTVMPTNGWRSGNDPTVRALRVLAVLGAIGLLVWWAVFDDVENIYVGVLLVGFLLLSLFGDIGITLPWFTAERRRDQREQEREDDASRTHMSEDDHER